MSIDNETEQSLATTAQSKIQRNTRPKPLLTVPEQIAHLKSKGVTFELCSEAEAARHLHEKCQFFRIYAYRSLFDKRVDGMHSGEYINLDFAHLKALSNIDRQLRDVLLPMTLDVEHFAKVRLLSAATDNKEDGYSIVNAYLEGSPKSQRIYIANELDKRIRDPYIGSTIRKHRSNIPLWAFVEVVPFGMFLKLFKYCVESWGDTEMKDTYHQLCSTRKLRNACAHDVCILNNLSSQKDGSKSPVSLNKALASYGFSKRLRSRWLKSPYMVQICSLLNLYAFITPNGSTRNDRVASLRIFQSMLSETRKIFPTENQAISSLLFIERLTKASGLIK